jgi:hypothetical protein
MMIFDTYVTLFGEHHTKDMVSQDTHKSIRWIDILCNSIAKLMPQHFISNTSESYGLIA